MHVLILPSEHVRTAAYPLGAIFQIDLASALKRSGVQVGLLSVGKVPMSHLLRRYVYHPCDVVEDVPVLRKYWKLPWAEGWDSSLWMWHVYVMQAEQLFRDYCRKFGKPALLHAHNVRYAGLVAATLAQRHGLPYVVTEHSSEYKVSKGSRARAVARACLEQAAAVTAVSPSFSKRLTEALGLEPGRVLAVPNLLPGAFSAPALATPSPRSIDPIVILNVAELVEVKNHRLLIESFAQAFRGGSAQLRIAGGGPLAGYLEGVATKAGVRAQVSFLGRISRAEVLEEMRRATFFALSSEFETFGVVVVEALSQGLPVLSTSCGGPSDIVGSNDGLLTPTGDVGAMATAMQRLAAEIDSYDRAEIVRRCHERFGECGVTARFIEIYRKACE